LEVKTIFPVPFRLDGLRTRKSTAWIFPLYFQLPYYLPAASRIFCSGRYQLGCTRIFWPAEGTSQPVTISRTWVQAVSVIFDLFPRLTGLRHKSQITEGPCTRALLLHWMPRSDGSSLSSDLFSVVGGHVTQCNFSSSVPVGRFEKANAPLEDMAQSSAPIFIV
jgi:hypothetical protein